MYLMQMSEIPLLSLPQEVAIAQLIEGTRRRFRRTLLSTGYPLQAAVNLLRQVQQGAIRLERAVEVPVIELRRKGRLMKRLGPNLQTLGEPAAAEPAGFRHGGRLVVIRQTTAAGLAAVDAPPQQGRPSDRGTPTPGRNAPADAQGTAGTRAADGRALPRAGATAARVAPCRRDWPRSAANSAA